MEQKDLELLQNLPLEIKVAKTKRRIEEWVYRYGLDRVYISFSGGKDSTVLLHIARQLYPSMLAVFVDTGLEYPELKQFVNKQKNVVTLRPKMGFKEVIETYGYPFPSKEQAKYIDEYKHSPSEKVREKRWNNGSDSYGISKKWRSLVDAPFEVSAKCCDIMKKEPMGEFQKASRRKPIVGSMAIESNLRRQSYLKKGCNSYTPRKARSMPLGFWTEQDILLYIKTHNVEICEIYGDIIEENGKLRTTGVDRSGCVFCLFGINYDGVPNRIQKLKQSHPQLHNYCINNLNLKQVMDFANIPYE